MKKIMKEDEEGMIREDDKQSMKNMIMKIMEDDDEEAKIDDKDEDV
jgi:hypothetical protein